LPKCIHYLIQLHIGLFGFLQRLVKVEVDPVKDGALLNDELAHLFKQLAELVDALRDLRDFLIAVVDQEVDLVLLELLLEVLLKVFLYHLHLLRRRGRQQFSAW